jgi:hypothetical protein
LFLVFVAAPFQGARRFRRLKACGYFLLTTGALLSIVNFCFIIFFCSLIMPSSNASGLGGQPGM